MVHTLPKDRRLPPKEEEEQERMLAEQTRWQMPKLTSATRPELQRLKVRETTTDAEAYLSGVSPPARAASPKRQPYAVFFASCRAPEKRALAPLPECLDG